MLVSVGLAHAEPVPEGALLALPHRGALALRMLSPEVLELSRVGAAQEWDFAAATPRPDAFTVSIGGRPVRVVAVGFKRRVRYAAERVDDLRVTCTLYLRLAREAPPGSRVRVASRVGSGTVTVAPLRWSPAIHVNHEGYVPHHPKVALVGAWLGTMGELVVGARRFSLVDASGREVFHGRLRPRPEQGAPITPAPYREVLEADFSAWERPGRYRIAVEGMGASFPFRIDAAVPAVLARAYALGLYHQRCGAPNALPFTRFVHTSCHLAPAEVPTAAFVHLRRVLADLARARDPAQTARPLDSVGAALYPYVRKGRVDVHGGHHDAGDYGKYLVNSAQTVATLLFAADQIPGATRLDNLGLPESGDGRSDLVQIARWEADFIGRAQDADGGFYFLVQPRDRVYESDHRPDQPEPQIVFPKSTAATAACVAALAQTSSSPTFRAVYPQEAARCLRRARAGFAFLERAWRAHGRGGAWQRVNHYGAEFGDRDEVVWAEAEMFIATGERRFEEMLRRDLHPDDPRLMRWSWWRLFEGYGAALRAIAFRGAARGMDRSLVEACRQQIVEGGRDQAAWAAASAYRTSYPLADKRFGNAAWHAGADRAFDAVAASLLTPSAALLDTIVGNVDFDLGANPSDVGFVTGLGWRRPREIVSQAAANDDRVLPPSGLPIGSMRAFEPVLPRYGGRLRGLSYPPDERAGQGYPIYDRWSDTWTVQTELITATQARCLATAVYLMCRTPLVRQPWRPVSATIRAPLRVAAGTPVIVSLQCPSLDLQKAVRIVWERTGAEPVFGGTSLRFTATAPITRVEAEAQMADGRRAFAVADIKGL